MDDSISQMKQDLALSRYAPGTQEQYIREIERLSARFKRPLASLTRDELRRYVEEVIEQSHSTARNVRLSALLFLYRKTLGRPEMVSFISLGKQKSKVPEALSLDEVNRFLQNIDKPRYRIIAMVLYGAGLRISEALPIQVTDIDGARGVIRVRNGKGNNEREAKLSQSMYQELRGYWARHRPPLPYVFASKKGRLPCQHAIRRAFKLAALRAEITKHVTPHVLRHSFATNLLEEGVDIRVVGALLGHASPESTYRYARVTKKIVQQTPSPLDLLPKSRKP